MNLHYCDWRLDNVKMASELISDAYVQRADCFTGSYPEANPSSQNAVFMDVKPLISERVDPNVVGGFSSLGQFSSNLHQNAAVKAEVYEDDTSFTDSFQFVSCWGLPNPASTVSHEEDKACKSESNFIAENIINEERGQVDFRKAEGEMRVRGTSYSSTDFLTDGDRTGNLSYELLGNSSNTLNFVNVKDEAEIVNPTPFCSKQYLTLSEFNANSESSMQSPAASISTDHHMNYIENSTAPTYTDISSNGNYFSTPRCSAQLKSTSFAQKYVPPRSKNTQLYKLFLRSEDKVIRRSDQIVNKHKRNKSKPMQNSIPVARPTPAGSFSCNKRISDAKPFSCNQCSYSSKENGKLQRHMMIHSDDRSFSCDKCPARFKLREHLKSHFLTHSSEKPFSCNQCSYTCNRKENARQHMLSHSNEKPFSCDQCSSCFKSDVELKQHMVIHSNEKPFSCGQCSFRCKQKGYLKTHLRTKHSNEKPFSCDECSFACKLKETMKVHLLSHSKEKPFFCDHCSYSSNRRGNLQLHMLYHSNDRPFSCDQCPANFKTGKELKRHSVAHSEDKPYFCNQCPAHFKTRADLKQHSIIHLNEKPFSCSECSASFKRSVELKQHSVVHSDTKPFFCAQCHASFAKKGELNKHLKCHLKKTPFYSEEAPNLVFL